MTKIKKFVVGLFSFLSLWLGVSSYCQAADITIGHYYIGYVGEQNCILKFDAISSTDISGTYYLLNESQLLNSQKFAAKVGKKKYKLTLGDNQYSVKLSWTESGPAFRGSFTAKKSKGDFYFTEYQSPEYKNYPARYQKECFDVVINKDVEYGKANGFWTSYPVDNEEKYSNIIKDGISGSISKKELSLRMDVYQPKNDTLKERPLLMIIHGGAFYIGDKAGNCFKAWSKHFASLGYVVVSLNYRIGFRLSKSSIERTGYNALQDAHAAMRYLVSHRKDYGIDTSRIFVAGSSAGSITSLNLAFMRNNNRPESTYGNKLVEDLGNIESSGNKIKANFHIRAVGNMWGAVNDLALLNNSRTSIISFHGDQDQLVPYDSGYPFSDVKGPLGKIFFDEMYGSMAIHRKAQSIGLREEMHTLEGLGHAPQEDKKGNLTPSFYFIQDKMGEFFYPEIVNDDAKISKSAQSPLYYIITGSNIANVNWKIEGGLILTAQGNTAKVVWLSDTETHKLYASGYYTNGAAFEKALKYEIR